jgi:hypothetical protein
LFASLPIRSRVSVVAALLALAACSKSSPTPGGLGDPCITNGDCATGFLCSGGVCVLPANLGGCEAGRLRCNGDDVEKCDPTGETWAVTATCATGCISGACAPQSCTPNAFTCAGNALEQCTPAGTGFAFLQSCPAGCDAANGKCKAPICTPFQSTCSSDGLAVKTCDSTGAAQTTTPCATNAECLDGRCVTHVCTPGARRCELDAAEQCSPDGTAWILVSICPSHCDKDMDAGTAYGQCESPICTPFALSCSADNTAVLTCDSFGAAEVSTMCGAGQICDTGRCQTKVCTPGATRCASGNAGTEICNALGDGWTAGAACPYSCGTSAGGGACLVAACAVGDTVCSGAALEQCLPSRTGFAFETFCSTGCTTNTATSASCAALVCTPLTRICAADAKSVQTCNQLGTAYQQTDVCPQGCSAGQCVTTSAGCTVGDLRCNGLDTQACSAVTGAPGVTQWSLTGTCLNGCSSGACLPGGSCVSLSLEVGAPVGDAGVPIAAADGISTVLIYSDPILGTDGAPIADGKLFTVTATLPNGSATAQLPIRTPDADPATPGTQIATSGGRIRFAVPTTSVASSATVTISARLEQGGSCAGTATYTMSTDPAVLGASVLLAEDFSSTAFRDSVNTSANWSTTQQELIGAWPDPIGNGGDGNFTVATNTTVNLATSGYAPAFAVLGLSTSSATVDGVPQGLSGGDEVILWDAQGSAAGAGNAGTYELLTVRSTNGSVVNFTSAIQYSYGAAADQDVASQRVSLQRVPHFATLTVAAGGTLTTNAWDGTKGGLIFFRATKLVLGTAANVLTAAVDVSGLGFRGGAGSTSATAGEDATGVSGLDAPGGGAGSAGSPGSGGSYGSLGAGAAPGAVYGSKLLGKLFLGAGGGGTVNGASGTAGGGAALIFADSIDYTVTSSGTSGLVRANGAPSASTGNGSGGTIWIGSPTMTVGSSSTSLAQAQGGIGGNKGGDGRIRLDAQALDATGTLGANCARTAPACNFGVNGAVQAQSTALYTAPSTSSIIVRQASLLVALDASPQISFFVAATAPGADPNDFGSASGISPGATVNFSSSTEPKTGPSFRWRAVIAPEPAIGNASVGGLQWQIQVK